MKDTKGDLFSVITLGRGTIKEAQGPPNLSLEYWYEVYI